jgi:hypothetical protein
VQPAQVAPGREGSGVATSTILDEAALSARQVADQFGRPSMTQAVYLARRAVDSQAALALEAASSDLQAAGESAGRQWPMKKARHRDGI